MKKKTITIQQEAVEKERERIKEIITSWHKELYDQLKDRPSYDSYSNDYKHGILRGYTLVGRFFDSLTLKESI